MTEDLKISDVGVGELVAEDLKGEVVKQANKHYRQVPTIFQYPSNKSAENRLTHYWDLHCLNPYSTQVLSGASQFVQET